MTKVATSGKELIFHLVGSQVGISKLKIVLPCPYYKLFLSLNIVYCKFKNFVRALFSRNFAYAKFCENKILMNWINHSVVYLYG